MSAVVDTFGLALPGAWVRFPLEQGADFESFARSQRELLEREAKLSKTAQRQFELLMRAVRADCERANVRLVASMVDALGTENSDDAELLAAACTIAVLNRRDMGSEVPLTTATMVVAMSKEPREQDDGSEITNLEPPDIVQLPAGQAVRLVRMHTYRPPEPGATRPKVFVEHFLLPINDGEEAALITFVSPTVQHAKPLSTLFARMIETFRLFAGEDPTDPFVDSPNEA